MTYIISVLKYILPFAGTLWLLAAAASAAPVPHPSTYDGLETFRAGEDNLWVDAAGEVVYLKARATEIVPGEPVEFILIHESSGHGYEAVAKTKVLPSALHQALLSIGIKHGQPADQTAYRFWPEGDRVGLRMHWLDPESGEARSHPAEEGVDLPAGKRLTTGGWLFTGSSQVQSDDGRTVYGADAVEPSSLVSLFNTPYTVLDLPDRNPQGAVYGERIASQEFHLPEHHPMVITLEPLYASPRPTAVRHVFRWAPHEDAPKVTVDRPAGKSTTMAADELVLWLRDLIAEGLDPYVELHFDPQLTLAQLQSIAALMDTLESPTGLRILPPPERHFFFRAFLPPESYRERKQRPSQPVEYHLEGKAVKVLDEQWTEAGQSITVSNSVLSATNTLVDAVSAVEPLPPALFVYAPADYTRQQLHEAVDAVADRFPIIYFFKELP